jgi:ABC-2 type transport system ATP-binding protein
MNQDIQTSHAVVAEGLGKRYGEQWALRGFDLAVPTGSVLGLLGHNGAGKTTAIRILTTLASPTEGTAKVVGHDVVAEPDQVREEIGLTSQSATVDGLMSGADNLEMIGRLYHLPRKVAQARAKELLAELQLEDAGDRLTWPPASSPLPRSSSSTSPPPASTRKAATSCGTCSGSWSAAGRP